MLSQASKVTGIGLVALACGALLVPACSSGGSDDEPTAGSGGSGTGGSSAGSGTGGNNAGTATGGTAGSSGGSGGNTMQVVTACPGVEPASTLIADFDAGATEGKYEWGSADQGTMDFWGGTFNYPTALEVTFADGAMTAAGHITEYAGFGLYVQNCADASAYEGVRFKIKGNPPMGKLSFAVQTNKNEWASGTKGSCLAPDAQKFINCVHPSLALTITEEFTTVDVKWADLKSGKPAAAATTDGSDVIGLQFILPWMEKGTPYDASVTIDDVEFIGEDAGGSGAGGAGTGGAGNEPVAGAGGAQ
jgi:hypothetical protein